MIFALIFVILNVVNASLLSSLGYDATTWEYWLSMVCVCGAYLAGALKTYYE